jgi:hypothetical protein
MTKITWIGSDDPMEPHTTVWNGVIFERGKPIDVDNEYMIRKARAHPHYRVSEHEEAKHEIEAKTEGQGKIEAQAEVIKKETDDRKAEKGTGYSPVAKKPKKKIPAAAAGTAADARPSDDVA